MRNAAILAGSFDPFTRGHYDVAQRAAGLFDELIVAVAEDTGKTSAPLGVRKAVAEKSCAGLPGVRVCDFTGLLTDFCKRQGIFTLVRGLRTYADFEYEKALSCAYKTQESKIETLYLLTDPSLSHISGSLVRALAASGGDLTAFVCDAALEDVVRYYGKKR